MKYIISILISIIGCANIYAQTPNDSLMQAASIVDGLFFDKSTPTKSLVPGNATLALLKDPDGAMVIAIYLPKGFALDESMKAKAIPAEKVKHSAKLLRDYRGCRPYTEVWGGIGVTVGKPMVNFEYSDIDHNVWNNEKLKNKVYVINLWQTECGPCRREMPTLSQWKEKYPDVVFLSASRHNREEILPIAEKHNFTWTHLQEASDLVALVRQEGFPLTIVVDKEGIVRFAKVGASEENQSAAISIIEQLSH